MKNGWDKILKLIFIPIMLISCNHEFNHFGSLTLCLPLDFHNPLQHSPLRLIFLSNFKIFLVIVCHCVV